MEDITTAVIFVAVILFGFLITKFIEYSLERKLKELVAWSVSDDPSECRYNGPLHIYISNAQNKLSLPQEYRICGDDEWDVIKEILKQYQKELTQDYFLGKVHLFVSKYVIYGEVYFMYALERFLDHHQCDYSFLSHKMQQETISYKSYGSWGGPLFDATFSLTDFAVVYHKLYYIAYLFCKNSKVINPKSDSYQGDNSIKEILDTRQIQISRF